MRKSMVTAGLAGVCLAGCPPAGDNERELTVVEIFELYEDLYSDDADLAEIVDQIAVILGAVESLSGPPLTDSIVLTAVAGAPNWFVAGEGDVITLSAQFASRDRDVVGVGVRYGDSNDVVVVDAPGANGSAAGNLSVDVEIDGHACSDLPEGCNTSVFQLFGVTADGAVSQPLLIDVVFACGDCDDESCLVLLDCPV